MTYLATRIYRITIVISKAVIVIMLLLFRSNVTCDMNTFIVPYMNVEILYCMFLDLYKMGEQNYWWV